MRRKSARSLTGGQGRAWSAEGVVLKPVDDVAEAVWAADLLSRVPEDGFRVSRPVSSSTGDWVVDGWSAWEELPGEHDTSGRWTDVLEVGRRLNRTLADVPRPAFLDSRTHAWAVADRMAWGDRPVAVVHDALRRPVDRLVPLLRPDDEPGQVIHGDLTGNVLFAPDRPPGVIDFTPYWRPARFCLAVVAVDAVLWHGAPAWPADEVAGWTSLLARAALRRLLTSDLLDADIGSTVRDHERVQRLLEEEWNGVADQPWSTA